jgi:predicted nucleic acid-binding protein
LKLFLDTGPIVAYYNKRDRDHPTALESFEKISENKTPYTKLYTSDYVLDEAITNCRARTRNHKLSVQLGTDIFSSKTIVLLKVDEDVLQRSWDLYKQRSDVEFSFTDCTIASLCKTHGISTIFTFDDKHIGTLGFHPLAKL